VDLFSLEEWGTCDCLAVLPASMTAKLEAEGDFTYGKDASFSMDSWSLHNHDYGCLWK
jgi:hypothetical protein